MIIIDATSQIVGGVASYSAKKALLGKKIAIVNCEKAIWSGRRKFLEGFFKDRKERGHPYDGPFYPKMADRIFRRTIRGMLPYRQERGEKAYKNIMCYRGIPNMFKDKKFSTIPGADASKLKTSNYLQLEQISKLVGK